jgi:hypothetical protein
MVLEFLEMMPLKKKIYLTYTYKSKVDKWGTCVQLDLEVVCKSPPKKRMPPNFYEFWNEGVYHKKTFQNFKILFYIMQKKKLKFFPQKFGLFF